MEGGDMTRTENARKRFAKLVEHLRKNGWAVDVKADENGETLSATTKREWYDRYDNLVFGYNVYTWSDGSKHVMASGLFFASKTSASRRIDRKVRTWRDAHRIGSIYSNAYRDSREEVTQ
jgi:hypothetical protein